MQQTAELETAIINKQEGAACR